VNNRTMLSPFFAWDLFDEPTERRPQWAMLNNFTPLVDIKETQQAITLRCEVPGIPPECVNVDFNDGCVIISGMKASPQEEGRYYSQQHGKHHHKLRHGQQGREGFQSRTEPSQQQQGREPSSEGLQQQGQFQQGQQQQGQQFQQGQQLKGVSGTSCPTSSASGTGIGLGREQQREGTQQGQFQGQQKDTTTGMGRTGLGVGSSGRMGEMEECKPDTAGLSVGSTGAGTGWQTDTTQQGMQQGMQQQGMQQQGLQQQGQQRGARELQTGTSGLQSDIGSEREEKVAWHRIESASGEFRRSFRLPRGVSAKHISATSKYGVLEIVVSKPNELQKESGERININATA